MASSDSLKDDLSERLRDTPFSQLSLDEVTAMLKGFAELARREGVAELDSLVEHIDEASFRQGFRMAVNGTIPELIQTILETHMETLLHHQGTRYRMIVEGLAAIQAGDNPRIVEQKLQALYLTSWEKRETYQASVEELMDKLQGGMELGFDGITEVMTDMAILCRSGHWKALAQVVRVIDEKLLAEGLDLVVDGTMPEITRGMLETHMETLLHWHRTRCRMALESVMSIQSGDNPLLVAQKMELLYKP